MPQLFNKAKLLLALTVAEDECTVAKPELKTGRVKNFMAVFSDKLQELFKVQLNFLLFLIPLLFVLFWVKSSLMEQYMSDYNFTSYMGIGYAVGTDNPRLGIEATYKVYKLLILYATPAILFAGIGACGLFYTARGYMWKEPVIVHKAFYRGIKKLWKYVMPVFFVLSLLFLGLGQGIVYGLEAKALGNSDIVSILIMGGSAIVGLFVIAYLTYLLPMFACYKFKMKDYLKNSGVLLLLTLPTTLFIAIIATVPFLIMTSSGMFASLMVMLVIFIGGIFVALMFTAYSQTIFTTFIEGMYKTRKESENKKGGTKKKKENAYVNPKKVKKVESSSNNNVT